MVTNDDECSSEVRGVSEDAASLSHITVDESIIDSLQSIRLVDEECQTDIEAPKGILKIKNHIQYKDKQCGTPQKQYADACVGPNEASVEEKPTGFVGVPSIRNEEEY
ncbi:hypothetical protein QAD02_013955 [Eretmocerus hayati]|uniref:Uncharacterized protein n=1 Tax=Eretmocerus hayati TaxID=131215 RepID=A0ACC2P4Y0_9HYME|nr:hypothetical protein QAD02_013955 [Eretmocerus hayati]